MNQKLLNVLVGVMAVLVIVAASAASYFYGVNRNLAKQSEKPKTEITETKSNESGEPAAGSEIMGESTQSAVLETTEPADSPVSSPTVSPVPTSTSAPTASPTSTPTVNPNLQLNPNIIKDIKPLMPTPSPTPIPTPNINLNDLIKKIKPF